MYILIIIGVSIFLIAIYLFRPKEVETPQELPKQFGEGMFKKEGDDDFPDLFPPGNIPGINC